MDPQNYLQNKQDLESDIAQFSEQYQKLHRANWRLNAILILLGLVLSASVTVAGMFNQGIMAALLGVAIAFLIGIQNAFPMSDKAEFYRVIVAESQNMLLELKHTIDTKEEFEIVVLNFQTLRKHAAAGLPRGQGMEAVRNMYKELSYNPK